MQSILNFLYVELADELWEAPQWVQVYIPVLFG